VDTTPAAPIPGAEWRYVEGAKSWAFVTEAEEAQLVRDAPHSVRLDGKPVWLNLREPAGRSLLKEVARPLAVDISVDELREDSMVAALRSLAAKQPLRMLLYTREAATPGQYGIPGDIGRVGEIERLDALGILGAIKPGEAAKVASLKSLTDLNLGGVGLKNDDLEHLRGLTNLEHLEIGNNLAVRDDGLVHLKGLTKLRGVGVVGNRGVKGEGLKHLAELKELRSLGLQFTGLNDAGLANLAPFMNLERLNLSGTDVTDSGLKPLYNLKKLTRVRLQKTKVTDAGIAELKKHLPKATIEH
jgi:hypothetical protein